MTWCLSLLANLTETTASAHKQPWLGFLSRTTTKTLRATHTILDSATTYAVNHLIARLPQTRGPTVRRSRHQRRNNISRYGVAKRLFTLTSVLAFATPTPAKTNYIHIDTDSTIVGVDNRASRCILNMKSDFTGEMRPVNLVIQGYGGVMRKKAHIGTLKWDWQDDMGTSDTFHIKDAVYDP